MTHNDTATVSVVIPVYNGAKFIAKAIDSVLSQTYPVHELIVINDGSKDDTARVLEGYAGRIKAVHIPNGGVSNARSTGVRHATGDAIAFLDADDVWRHDKLAKQMAALAEYPEVGFTCCNFLTIRTSGNAVPHFDHLKTRLQLNFERPLTRSPLAVLIEANVVGTCSNVVIRRSVLDQTGLFNTGYRQSEDYDLWLRCALVTKFLIQEECLLDKIAHQDNLTNNMVESLSCHELVLHQFWQANQNHPEVKAIFPLITAAVVHTQYKLGDALFNAGRKSEAFAYFWKAFRTSPSISNLPRFGWAVGKKLVRLVSGDTVRRRST